MRSFSLSGGLLVNSGGVWSAGTPVVCTFGLTGCRVKPRRLLQNVKNNFTIDLPPPPLPLDFRKSQWSIVVNFACIQKKVSNTTEIPRDDATSPLSGPTPLGPHCFWVVVCAVCAAPDSAACCCFSCCLCSCCGLLLPLFFAACACCCFWAADRRTLPSHLCNVWPSKMLMTFFTTDWSPYTSTNWDKICIPPNFLGKTLLLPPPSWVCPSPHSGLLAPVVCCVKNTPLPLLTFQNVCTALVAFLCCFCHFLLLVFLVVCCFSCCSCCFCCCFCCFVAARFWPSKKFLLLIMLFVLLCCCGLVLIILFVLLFVLFLLLLLLFLFLLALFCFFCCSCCFCCRFWVADRWSWTPPLPFLTSENVKNNLTIN